MTVGLGRDNKNNFRLFFRSLPRKNGCLSAAVFANNNEKQE